MNLVSPICCFRSNRILSVQPKHTTRCHRFHHRKNILPLIHPLSSVLAPLNESCPLQASHFYQCFVLWLKDQTHSRQIPEGPSWKLLSKGKREITSKLNHFNRGREIYFNRRRDISRGRENTQEESNPQGSQMLGVQEERCHMSSWGERHVHMCLFYMSSDFAWFCILLWFSVPYLLPVSHVYDSGGARHLKERKSQNSLHTFTFGDMSIFNVVLGTHSQHVIPVLVLLWFLSICFG